MLQTRVGVGVAVSELINVVLAVEAEGKRHHIVPPVVWAAVVIHILGRQSLPATNKQNERQRDPFNILNMHSVQCIGTCKGNINLAFDEAT